MKYTTYHQLGFRKIVAVSPKVKVGDVKANLNTILEIVDANKNADMILFPELSITGYTCADLFNQDVLLRESVTAVDKLKNATKKLRPCVVVGTPVVYNNKIYNCAIFLHGGKIACIVPKINIPDYSEYYEQRWFESGSDFPESRVVNIEGLGDVMFGSKTIYEVNGMKVGAEICEDLWVPVPPSCGLAQAGADVIVNLSASNEIIGKRRYRRELIKQQSARCRCAYVYASAGCGESSTDLAFPGDVVIARDGKILAESEPFAESPVCVTANIDVEKLHHDRRVCNTFGSKTSGYVLVKSSTWVSRNVGFENEDKNEDDNIEAPEIDAHPFVPADLVHRDENCTEIINIQCHGLRQRLEAIGCKSLVIGVSGGLDSTLALLVACRTFDKTGISRKGIHAITMPGMATSDRTHNNAWRLMELLGVSCLEIPINKSVRQHFADIGHDEAVHDATYENSQARIRTMILMNYANKTGGIVLGTGDLSELALGWCTYNGDHMSMYGVNASVPKTLVKYLVEWFAERESNKEIAGILRDIIDTPISPELVPSEDGEEDIAQKTEDLVGPYELHDFFMYNMLRYGFTPEKIFRTAQIAFEGKYDSDTIKKWLKNFYRRFFNQQFKRSCMPDGPKVGSVCLSPRGDWRMPSDASSKLWLVSLG